MSLYAICIPIMFLVEVGGFAPPSTTLFYLFHTTIRKHTTYAGCSQLPVEGVLETTPHIFIKWQVVCFVMEYVPQLEHIYFTFVC